MASTTIRSAPQSSFWKHLDKLPDRIRERARQAYELFKDNPTHPMLRGHPVRDARLEQKVWSVWINREYRALAIVKQTESETVYSWYWCGSHADYNSRLGL